MENQQLKKKTAKDFASDQDVKWCPGCGDYSILKQMQSVLAEMEVASENTVFVSGIGCSSRFPYYMNTYGMHSIHGRATAIASGLKAANPNLDVWLITGDGDALSIGGNHFIHLLRRNFNLNILLFNNEIYGLTKGQYSPTSRKGTVTKSTPLGSLDHPFNPIKLALGAEATFIARTMDRDPKHMRAMLLEAQKHKGSSLVEIYQNCNVFNDGAFATFTDKKTKGDKVVMLEHDKPLIFGANDEFGIKLDGFKPVVVNLETDQLSNDDLWIHDQEDEIKAGILAQFFEKPGDDMEFPRPFGIFLKRKRFTYEDAMIDQINAAIETKGEGDLDTLLKGNNTWDIT